MALELRKNLFSSKVRLKSSSEKNSNLVNFPIDQSAPRPVAAYQKSSFFDQTEEAHTRVVKIGNRSIFISRDHDLLLSVWQSDKNEASTSLKCLLLPSFFMYFLVNDRTFVRFRCSAEKTLFGDVRWFGRTRQKNRTDHNRTFYVQKPQI